MGSSGEDESTCEHCGNMGYADSWPYVQARDQWYFPDNRLNGEVACDACFQDAIEQKGGGDGQQR